ncbi:protein of unknown function [Pseudodesulfovibrio piezophilus C1TLV30]|uniref:Uncharacterized protein n=1 Tax=Pseudodesulfovibrio piezophilus (strain DSM 21447 / JCM 15486 / C1TLV30) TaxID=1322246 RepID=M1WVK5_PSEP2|nr:protein of unknown function [Pseudodesulfovibrio piezophilus C1TLV30]
MQGYVLLRDEIKKQTAAVQAVCFFVSHIRMRMLVYMGKERECAPGGEGGIGLDIIPS